MNADKWAGLSLSDLLAERSALDAKIERVRAAERHHVIQRVRALIAEYGLSEMDVMPLPRKQAVRQTVKKAVAKYYDADTGKSWSGRGKPPRWIAGQDYSKFLIPAEGILRQLAQQQPATS
jgi:DNA-binding protein H-NS